MFLGPKHQSQNIPSFKKSHHHFKLMSQTDLLIFSPNSAVSQLSLSPPLSSNRPDEDSAVIMDASPWTIHAESVTKNAIFPAMHLSDLPLSFCSYTWSSFLHLERGCGFRFDSLAPDGPHRRPRAPRPPCTQLPAQLSEALLLAGSLIKTLQRPLTAYTTKSQPVCLSFKSLHYPLPLCSLHFPAQGFPQRSHFDDWSPHWPRCASPSAGSHAGCKLLPRPK